MCVGVEILDDGGMERNEIDVGEVVRLCGFPCIILQFDGIQDALLFVLAVAKGDGLGDAGGVEIVGDGFPVDFLGVRYIDRRWPKVIVEIDLVGFITLGNFFEGGKIGIAVLQVEGDGILEDC